jgi:hypothetical protein
MRVNRRSQRGAVIIYAVVVMSTMIGFSSLAVDYGRFEVCQTELHTAADAAVLAAVASLSSGGSAATTAATTTAGYNFVDGQSVSNSSFTVTVQFLNWTSPGNFVVLPNSTGANAVQVSIVYNVPTIFAQALGMSSKVACESAVATVTTNSSTQYISGKSNPWLAGEPTGTQASQPDPGWQGQDVNADHPWQYDIAGPIGGTAPDGQPYESPAQLSISVVPGSIITVTNVTGSAGNDLDQGAVASANGSESGSYYSYDDAASEGVAEHGMSDSTMPLNSINGVFLSSSLPDNLTTPPPTTDFSTQAERDYTNFQPQLQQVFYVGNGQTSGGTQQTITVPAGATRFFLGTMDGWEWSNNPGGYNATITQTTYSIVQ